MKPPIAKCLTSGAAALLWESNSKLTPNIIKMILMYTAQPLAGALGEGSAGMN